MSNVNDMRCNVVVMGKTGVGKSSLLNYLFGTQFEMGAGRPVTGEGLYECEAEVNQTKVRVFDSWGIEADKLKKWKSLLRNEKIKHGVEKDVEDWFHAVVYCIQAGGARIEDIDAEIVANFCNDSYRVIVALTKADNLSEKDMIQFTKIVSSEIRKRLDDPSSTTSFEIKPVTSVCKKTRMGLVEQTGRDEMINAILEGWRNTVMNRIPRGVVGRLQAHLERWADKKLKDLKSRRIDPRGYIEVDSSREMFLKDLKKEMRRLCGECAEEEAREMLKGAKEIGANMQRLFVLDDSSLALDDSSSDWDSFIQKEKDKSQKAEARNKWTLGLYAFFEKVFCEADIKRDARNTKRMLEQSVKAEVERCKEYLETDYYEQCKNVLRTILYSNGSGKCRKHV